jgi:flagellar protein FlaJ
MATGSGTASEATADAGASAPDVDDEPSFDVDLGDLFESFRNAYRFMDISMERYLLLVLLPSLVFGVLLLFGVVLLAPPAMLAGPLVLLGAFLPMVALVYPKILQDRHRKQIRERFHLFITHITVLSTTNIDRVEIFRTLAHDEEYRATAAEMGHIVALIDTWNQSLEDACRMRAQHVPSPLMSDFLDRLAYTVGAGQNLSEFLLSEQDSIVEQYATRYQADLDRLGVVKELYMSIIMSSTFALVFATIIPFLMGVDPMLTLSSVIVMFVFVQGMFVYVMNNVAPSDPVWHQGSGFALDRSVRIRVSLMVGVGLSLLLAALVYAMLNGYLFSPDTLPNPVYLALPFTPLVLPGYVMRREEQGVKNRDEEFPSFIRSLGAIESVKQASTSTVLTSLRKKDFGSLTESISNLYRRLSMRIDSEQSWSAFAAETGSYLIQKFSDMYVAGRQMGGEPRELGRLISENYQTVLNLRKKRAQEGGTIIGVLYGLSATSAFAFFVGLEIIRVLKDITKEMNLDTSAVGSLLHAEVYNLQEVQFLLFVAVLVNAFFSSLMIRVVDRGHSLTSLLHFVTIVWISAIIAVVTREFIGSFLSLA